MSNRKELDVEKFKVVLDQARCREYQPKFFKKGENPEK